MIKKKFVASLASILAGMMAADAFADTLTVNSIIQDVTIYKQGALVGRKATVKIPAGVTVVKIPQISPLLDQKSLQVGLSNNDISLGNIGIDFELSNLKDISEKDESIAKSLKMLNDSIDLNISYKTALDREYVIVAGNDDINGDKRLTPEQLSGVAAFLRSDLNDIEDRKTIYSRKLDTYYDSLGKLKQEVLLLEKRELKPQGVIYVTLVSKEAASTEINFKYTIKEAEWAPLYEIRVDGTGKNMLVKKEALVSQSSKEDWNNVKLTVSKVNPNNSNETPKLERYTLPRYSSSDIESTQSKKSDDNNIIKVMGIVRDRKGPMEGVLIHCKKNGAKTQSDKNGRYEITIPNNAEVRFTHAGYTEIARYLTSKNVLVNNETMEKSHSTMGNNTIHVTGRVVDESGPLHGAEITIKGKSQTTETDDDGYFNIDAPFGSVIYVDFLGYERKKFTVGDMARSSNITIKMQESEESLLALEVVSTKAKKAAKNKASSYDEESIQPEEDDYILYGGTAGSTGSHSTFAMRSLAPLYIVDGIQVSQEEAQKIDAKYIASIEKLTDRSEASVYGNRAAENGVVIIKTKKLYKSRFSALQDYTTEAHGLNTVPADGAEHDTYLGNDTLKAEFTYYAAPKFSPNVYMLAHVPNWYEHQLQAANIKVFIGNTFVGNSSWTPDLTSDTLTFSVCREKDVAVTRKLQTSMQNKKLVGTKKKVLRDWQIVVKNNKETPIELRVQDQVPVSKDSDVKVELLNISGAKTDESTGILTWDLHLSPGERKEINISYEVTMDEAYEHLLKTIE